MPINYFQMISKGNLGTTGTGFDQLTNAIANDIRLGQSISGQDLVTGTQSADGIFNLIVNAMKATGAAPEGKFTVEDLLKINEYIRANNYEEFVKLHGDDEGRVETGFHTVQADNASTFFNGKNLINKIVDSILHIGFEVKGDHLVNEDGNASMSLEKIAEYMTEFFVDRSTTNTGLDKITDYILADRGIYRKISDEDREEGATAANSMNEIIVEAMKATDAGSTGVVTADDVRAMNAYIQANHSETFAELYGTTVGKVETGFQAVQQDHGTGNIFGSNFINTIADAVYQIGSPIVDGKFTNPEGGDDAAVQDVADYLTYFMMEQGTTGTGLDKLVQIIQSDRGLAANTSAADIIAGAQAADGLNKLIVEAVQVQGLDKDGIFDIADIKAINSYIRENHFDKFIELHGDDEDGVETGFHLVQGDGGGLLNDAVKAGCTRVVGDKLIDMVMDGIYHLGFEIKGDKLLNEDGVEMNKLGNIANWLNEFYFEEKNDKFGTEENDRLRGKNSDDNIFGREGNDLLNGLTGDDFVDGGEGNDRVLGGGGNDTLFGGKGNDRVQGGQGNDLIIAGEGKDDIRGDHGDDVLIVESDNQRDTLRGGAGADSFMFWMEEKSGWTDRIMDFKRAQGDEIVLGGEVASFTVKTHKKKSFINMFDENGESLGRIKVIGRISAEDVRIDSEAFQTYSDELLYAGVDVSLEMEALEVAEVAVEEAPLVLEVEATTDAALVMGAQEELPEPLYTSISFGF